MLMPGRSFSATSKYRYGFNGKENDNEVKGVGNQQDYGMRIYDPRLGRFLSVDPLTKDYPWYTPYQFAGNKPVEAIDLDGAEEYLDAERSRNTKWLLFQREEKLKYAEFQQTRSNFPSANLLLGPSPTKIEKIPTRDEIENGRERLAKQEAARHAESVKPKNLLRKVGQAAIDIVETPFREADEFRQAVDAGDVGGAIKHGFNFGLSVATFVGPFKIGRPAAGGITTATDGVVAANGATFYRAMSAGEYSSLQSTGGLTYMEGKQLFVSTKDSYSRAYMQKSGYDVLVQFNMKPEAMNYFNSVGVTHRTAAGGSGWAARGTLLWKSEQGVLNLGIQQNTHLFNPMIESFKPIK
jgi:RHS repeat-associated protein